MSCMCMLGHDRIPDLSATPRMDCEPAGDSSAPGPQAVIDAPVEDVRAVDGKWNRLLREIQGVPQWIWNTAMFVTVSLMIVAAIVAFVVFLTRPTIDVLADALPTYPRELLTAANDAPADSKFTADNIQQFLTNYKVSKPLVIHPWYRKKNNPNPPKLRISSDVLATEKPATTTNNQVCTPLSCRPDKKLTVEAMDSDTRLNIDLNLDPNGDTPNVKPISTTNLRLCCGPTTITTPFNISSSGSLFDVHTAKRISTGQCQLVSDSEEASPSDQPIMPVQITGCCSTRGSLSSLRCRKRGPFNYPVRVTCADVNVVE
eukprot:815867_1